MGRKQRLTEDYKKTRKEHSEEYKRKDRQVKTFSFSTYMLNELSIQLQYYNLTRKRFFIGLINLFLEKDPNMIQCMRKMIKYEYKMNIAKQEILDQRGKENISNFQLNEDQEVKNIFDILEEEFPDF